VSKQTTILSTVLLEQPLIDRAAVHGIGLYTVSFIEVAHGAGEELGDEVEELCSLPVTAVFTSANAVRAIAETVQNSKPDWNIYCMGNTTAKAVREIFGEQSVKGKGNDAAELAAVIIGDDVCEVVFFCGDKRLDTLPETLRSSEISVHEIVVYHTAETPVKLAKQYDGILFFSPSGVSSFFSVNKVEPGTVLFAIGHTTANALGEYTNEIPVIGKMHSKEGLVDEAIQYFRKQVPIVPIAVGRTDQIISKNE
jgi:uroporphyrinogen-III synthase